jgi:hypothetical protein
VPFCFAIFSSVVLRLTRRILWVLGSVKRSHQPPLRTKQVPRMPSLGASSLKVCITRAGYSVSKVCQVLCKFGVKNNGAMCYNVSLLCYSFTERNEFRGCSSTVRAGGS